MARDKWRRNALYLLFSIQDQNAIKRGGKAQPSRIANSALYPMKIAPELIKQPDNSGFSPLHPALLQLAKYNHLDPFTEVAEISDSVIDLICCGTDTTVFPQKSEPFAVFTPKLIAYTSRYYSKGVV